MTLTIELSPAEEALLRSQAAERRQDPQTVAHGHVRSGIGAPAPQDISEADHERLVQRLLDLGMMTKRPSHPGQLAPFEPITVTGRPVSETLLEDRE